MTEYDSKGRYIVYSGGGSIAFMLLRKERGYKLFDGKSAGAKRFPRCIVGEWKCHETPLDNSELYSGYLSLIIRSDGNYLMYDAEAGNPCLKGTIEMDGDDLDLIFVDDSGVDFAPPAGWENMSKRQEIGYFADAYTLKLTYTDDDNSVTLVFDAVNAPNEVKN